MTTPDVIPLRDEFDLLTDAQVAALRGKSLGRHRKDRYRGMGPAFIKQGRQVLYRRADVDQWLASHRIDPEAS